MTEAFSIDQLRQCVINDYAQLCADDGGTQADETSLEDYKKLVSTMSWDELIEESSVIKNDPDATLSEYIANWLTATFYANLPYIKNEDGSTTLAT